MTSPFLFRASSSAARLNCSACGSPGISWRVRLWFATRAKGDTIDDQFQLLQSGVGHANYYSLYTAVVKDAAKGNDSLFFQWSDDWMRQRGMSTERRSGVGYSLTSAVIDRSTIIHFSGTKARPGIDLEDWTTSNRPGGTEAKSTKLETLWPVSWLGECEVSYPKHSISSRFGWYSIQRSTSPVHACVVALSLLRAPITRPNAATRPQLSSTARRQAQIR